MKKINFKETKTTIFLAVFFVIIVIVTVLCVLYPDVGEIFDLGNWFNTTTLGTVNYWVAIGFVSLLCFLGALVPVPIPYMIPVALFTAAWIGLYEYAWVLILGLLFFSAISNTLGDILDYYIGRGAEHMLSQDDPDLQNRWAQIILKRPKVIPLVIVVFGMSPLPESLLMVPLGMVKYDVRKTFFWMFVGKLIMMLIMVMFGAFAWDLDLFSGEGEIGWIMGVGSLYVMWIIILFMVKYKPVKET
ncbi:MAG: VTT domain-containing protein [Promethearchaeota archaeon]